MFQRRLPKHNRFPAAGFSWDNVSVSVLKVTRKSSVGWIAAALLLVSFSVAQAAKPASVPPAPQGREALDAGLAAAQSGDAAQAVRLCEKAYRSVAHPIHGAGSVAFAVGRNGTIVKYDGSSWSVVGSGISETLNGVWVGSGSLAFAVGEKGTILRYDGTSWSKMESGTTTNLKDIWGSDPNDVWAVGYGGMLLHFDGSKWSWVNSGTPHNLNGIWGTDAKNVWTVGDAGAILKWTTQ